MTQAMQTPLRTLLAGLEHAPSGQDALWPIFLNTVFHVPLNKVNTATGQQFTLALAPSKVNENVKSLLVSEDKAEVALFSSEVTQVQGGELLQRLPGGVELILPFGENAFTISAETVTWLRQNAVPA